jgi:hypothetical protein
LLKKEAWSYTGDRDQTKTFNEKNAQKGEPVEIFKNSLEEVMHLNKEAGFLS